MDTISILLVDDHVLFREALRGMLELEPGIRVAAEAGSAAEALAKLREVKVDVALLDLNLPDKDGVWLIKEIRKEWPALPLLMLSMHEGSRDVLSALAEGANGYLTKTVDKGELVSAIRTALNGGTHLSQAAARPVLQRLSETGLGPELPEVTEREIAILRLVVAGKNNKEIGDTICLSVSRVKFHLSELFEKFGVSDRTSLAVEASKLGILESAPK